MMPRVVLEESKDDNNIRSVWWADGRLHLIDQRLLPYELEIVRLSTVEEAARAIEEMVVRGAPAIGAAAAYALALAPPDGLKEAAERLRRTRPTARDLFRAVEQVSGMVEQGMPALEAAERYVEGVVDACRRIGEHGISLIRDGARVLTHCNAGALATVEFGTALAPIVLAHRHGKRVFVFVDETRPRLQGAGLTSWELMREGVEHAIIADNAAGYFMSKGEVDIVVVGADRIARNGDVANKIGTYEKAVIAKENAIPFYVAAPLTTFDLSTRSGTEIQIEERAEEEVLCCMGRRAAPAGARARNPAFDITPARYIAGYITENGVLSAEEIHGE
ncbi:MAG: S-methyl-5-thioribose-1-phosphate isomerase [Candidatus Thermoplasmatota archaeon]